VLGVERRQCSQGMQAAGRIVRVGEDVLQDGDRRPVGHAAQVANDQRVVTQLAGIAERIAEERGPDGLGDLRVGVLDQAFQNEAGPRVVPLGAIAEQMVQDDADGLGSFARPSSSSRTSFASAPGILRRQHRLAAS
jgi:hypothetical protein